MPSPFSKESEIFTDVTTVVCGLFTPPSAFTEEVEEKEEEDDDADVEDEDVEENVDVKVEEEVEVEVEVEVEEDDVKAVLPSLP